MKAISKKVFPSNQPTVFVDEDDTYGGAHRYEFTNCLGFENGETKYTNSMQSIQFVKKEEDGAITPGLQSEQLLIALIDRTKKLHEKFPCRQNALAITNMEQALFWFRDRVEERMERGVMGQLKK